MMFVLKIVIICIIFQNIGAQPTIQANLTGTYFWQLMLDIDNSNNSGAFVRETSVTISTFASYNNLKESLLDESLSSSISSSLSGTVYGVTQATVTASVNAEIHSTYKKIAKEKTETTTETKKVDKYTVGANSRLKLYRLIFSGPGVQYQTDTISSTPHPTENITIGVTLEQEYFLKDIEVIYTDDAVSQPENTIEIANEPSADINKRFDGKYVWLVPVWTTKVDEALTDIEFVLLVDKDPNYKNLGEGYKEKYYRYLKLYRHYPNNNKRIKKIGLWRSREDEFIYPHKGWHRQTKNINVRRGGDWLYLVWMYQTV